MSKVNKKRYIVEFAMNSFFETLYQVIDTEMYDVPVFIGNITECDAWINIHD